jgi:hypothetical protein
MELVNVSASQKKINGIASLTISLIYKEDCTELFYLII